MPHSISPIAPITLPSYAPGTSASFDVNISGTVQPQATATGSINVEFNGETASTPLSITFNETITPSIEASALDPRLSISFGSPLKLANGAWQFPAVLTVV